VEQGEQIEGVRDPRTMSREDIVAEFTALLDKMGFPIPAIEELADTGIETLRVMLRALRGETRAASVAERVAVSDEVGQGDVPAPAAVEIETERQQRVRRVAAEMMGRITGTIYGTPEEMAEELATIAIDTDDQTRHELVLTAIANAVPDDRQHPHAVKLQISPPPVESTPLAQDAGAVGAE
jgi:hypothetical protein